MKRHIALVLVAALAPGPASIGVAGAQPVITRWVVAGGGGGWVQNGPIVLAGTAGQSDAGFLTGGRLTLTGGFWIPGAPQPVGVEDGPPPAPPAAPLSASVAPAAPNPFLHSTRIAFELPETRAVRVQVFDVAGALQRTLADGPLPPGRHWLDWDGADDTGRRVRAGLYFLRVGLGDLHRSQKIIVLR